MENNRKRLIEELFGSDEGEDDDDLVSATSEDGVICSEILPGLQLYPKFLQHLSNEGAMNKKDGWNHNNDQTKETKHRKKDDQDSNTRKEDRDLQYPKQLLRTIMANYPFTAELNQVMAFGKLPDFICPVIECLEATQKLFPRDILERRPLFDQMICNYYEPGQGITPHVDLLSKFTDGIVIISLGSSCVMDFRPVANIQEDEKCSQKQQQKGDDDGSKISVLLEPGDVLAISGEARYKWTHGIAKHLVDDWKGKPVPRGKRVSITLRRLLPTSVM